MKSEKPTNKSKRTIAAPASRPNLKRILTTTDFSEQSLPAVRYALALGQKTGAAVTILYVVKPALSLPDLESLPLAGTGADAVALAHKRLAELGGKAAAGAAKVTTAVATGVPFDEITRVAGTSQADLIVMGTHGHTGWKRVWLGSTAERVVRHAPCPVLTVPTRGLPKSRALATPLRLKKVLVPIDFSNLSKAALPWATYLAAQSGAEIILFHVVEKFPIDYLLGAELISHAIVPMMKQAEADLAQLSTRLSKSAGVKISSEAREGAPFEEICRAAKELEVDLIILTTRGNTGLKHVWLGSTAERVVRLAHCPVLAVR